jgi:hypothetical protein
MNYCLHEGEIIIPENTQDQSLTIFGLTEGQPASAVGPGQPPEFSFVISRQPLPNGLDAHTYTDQQLKGLPQILRGFALIERTAAPLSGRVASLLEFTWQSEHGLMYQRQAIVACGPIDDQPAAALTLTGTTREDLKDKYPLQVTDPQNLVQTPDRQTSWNSHQALHEAASSDPNTAIGKWKGPIDAIHELSITPTPAPPAAPDLNL